MEIEPGVARHKNVQWWCFVVEEPLAYHHWDGHTIIWERQAIGLHPERHKLGKAFLDKAIPRITAMAALPVQAEGMHELVTQLAQVSAAWSRETKEVDSPGGIIIGQLALSG